MCVCGQCTGFDANVLRLARLHGGHWRVRERGTNQGQKKIFAGAPLRLLGTRDVVDPRQRRSGRRVQDARLDIERHPRRERRYRRCPGRVARRHDRAQGVREAREVLGTRRVVVLPLALHKIPSARLLLPMENRGGDAEGLQACEESAAGAPQPSDRRGHLYRLHADGQGPRVVENEIEILGAAVGARDDQDGPLGGDRTKALGGVGEEFPRRVAKRNHGRQRIVTLLDERGGNAKTRRRHADGLLLLGVHPVRQLPRREELFDVRVRFGASTRANHDRVRGEAVCAVRTLGRTQHVVDVRVAHGQSSLDLRLADLMHLAAKRVRRARLEGLPRQLHGGLLGHCVAVTVRRRECRLESRQPPAHRLRSLRLYRRRFIGRGFGRVLRRQKHLTKR
mmetsp:Transcript_8039/g.19926  ORF Transcript_8039/g.19926 Transcript_8039/m.19926 type:complete len:394 (-) Transcript_8039:214-1395(-)